MYVRLCGLPPGLKFSRKLLKNMIQISRDLSIAKRADEERRLTNLTTQRSSRSVVSHAGSSASPVHKSRIQ